MHAISAHINSVSRGTGLSPNEVHDSRYPRMPMTIPGGWGVRVPQGTKADHVDYLQLMIEIWLKAYGLVRQEDV